MKELFTFNKNERRVDGLHQRYLREKGGLDHKPNKPCRSM